MLIKTRIASAGMSLEACSPTEKQPFATQEVLSFELLPTDDRDHLDLDTGEVFQDYNYARRHGNAKKLIGASMTIRPMPDVSYYQFNVMHYIAEHKSDDFNSPSSIYFTAYIEPAAFHDLADSIKRGLF